MPYDENSFLQGIAVGRSMKGVTVIGGGGGGESGGSVSVTERSMTAVGIIYVSTEVPSGEGYESLDTSGMLYIDTQYSRTSSPTVPYLPGYSSFVSSHSMSTDTELAPVTASAVPDTQGYSVAVSASMTAGE